MEFGHCFGCRSFEMKNEVGAVLPLPPSLPLFLPNVPIGVSVLNFMCKTTGNKMAEWKKN